MKIAPDFPDYRHQDPKRQAELGVYQQIAASGAPGVALYECHPTPSSPEVDFVIILEGVAHFAVQVKGGHWRLEEGQFQLLTDQGWVNDRAAHPGLQRRLRRAQRGTGPSSAGRSTSFPSCCSPTWNLTPTC